MKPFRVGTNVLNNDLRHPVLVAREAAAVDLLTDGRLLLGLGAGSIRSEYQEAGLRFEPGRVRVERLAEAVTVIKALLNGEEVNFAGRHYQLAGHTIGEIFGRAAAFLNLVSADPPAVILVGPHPAP